MISERDIAEKFTAAWKQHFPLLTANFMRVFNEAKIEKINTFSIPIIENIRYDLVSEIAFNLSERSIQVNKTPDKYLLNKKKYKDLIEYTISGNWVQTKIYIEDLSLTPFEISEILKIANNIIEFVNKTKKENHQFNPKLKGYNFLPDLTGDISIDDTLYEIKTVNRNFKSSDLKQLLIYLALQQVTGKQNWKYGGLFNPRKGTFCKFNIKGLVFSLTGGKSPNEAFEGLLNELVRDIQIDSKF